MLPWEREFIRDLAKEKAELSARPEMLECVKNWRNHNDLKSSRPVVVFEMGTVGDAGFNYECKTQSDDARSFEYALGESMQNYKMIGDDRPCTPDFIVGNSFGIRPFSLEPNITHSDGVGFHINPIINDLDSLDFIKPSRMSFNAESGQRRYEAAAELFGDILEVKRGMGSIAICPTYDIVILMTMDNMFAEMCANPDNFKVMTEALTADYIKYLREIETRGLLLPCCDNTWLGQGSFALNDELPAEKDGDFLLTDIWGYMNSQETVGVSPDMFNEFIFPCYEKVGSLFGRLSYGCCEPVHAFWDKSLSKLKNLNKISISPWCDEYFMGERLAGSRVIYARKPDPNFTGVGVYLDEDAFRAHIDKTLEAARGCKLEITFRDVYNISGQLDKPRRAVEIVREEIETKWRD